MKNVSKFYKPYSWPGLPAFLILQIYCGIELESLISTDGQ